MSVALVMLSLVLVHSSLVETLSKKKDLEKNPNTIKSWPRPNSSGACLSDPPPCHDAQHSWCHSRTKKKACAYVMTRMILSSSTEIEIPSLAFWRSATEMGSLKVVFC